MGVWGVWEVWEERGKEGKGGRKRSWGLGAVQSANWKMQRVKWVGGRVATLLFALAFLGCETAFEPFEESERAFSLFGYVDAAADVQFVRVSPLRDSLHARAEPLDATVTMEHVGTGETSVWRDSLFFFEGAAAHNFWSDVPIELGATYRMAVERDSDGAVSTATFRMPDREPDVGAAFDMFSPAVSVEIRKTDVLVRAELVYTVELSSGVLARRTLSYLDEAIRFTDSEGDAGYAFEFNQTTARERVAELLGPSPFRVLAIDVAVASAGPDWPDFAAIERETLALPDAVGNVEGGVGFVGGVVSKTVRILGKGAPSSES